MLPVHPKPGSEGRQLNLTFFKSGLEAVPDSDSDKARRFMDEEIARWGPVVKASGFKVE